MVALALGILVLIGVAWAPLATVPPEELFEWIFLPFLSLALGGIVGVGAAAGATGLANLALDHHDHYRKVDLVAIRDTTGIAGTFVWGSGSIGSTGNYFFYYQDGKAKRLANVDGSNVNLYEDSKDAYAIEYLSCDLSLPWLADCFDNGPRFVEIHVPPGTVKPNINLALNP